MRKYDPEAMKCYIEAKGVERVTDPTPFLGTRLSTKDAKETIRHLGEVAEWFNASYENLGLPLRMLANAAIEDVEAYGGYSPIVRAFCICKGVRVGDRERDGVKSGRFFNNNIINFERILSHFLPNKNGLNLKVISMLGLTQCGKTTTHLSLHFVAPTMYVLSYYASNATTLPLVYHPILLVPNRNSLEDESNKSLLNMSDLYGKMRIVSTVRKGGVITGEFWKAQDHDKRNGFSNDDAYYRLNSNGIQFKVFQDEVQENLPHEKANLVAFDVAKRATRAQLEKVRDSLQKILNSNGKSIVKVQREFILTMDEADHGSSGISRVYRTSEGEREVKETQGLMHFFLNLRLTYNGKSQSILDVVKNQSNASCLLNSSATLYEYMEQNADTSIVKLKVGEGYVGWNVCWNPKTQRPEPVDDDPTLNIKSPENWGRSKSAAVLVEYGWFWPYLTGNAFATQAGLNRLKANGCSDRIQSMSLADYKKHCVKALAEMLNWATRQMQVGDDIVRYNAVVRFHNTKAITDLMVLQLSAEMPETVIDSWTEDSSSIRAEEFFYVKGLTGKPVVMFVVAKGRRGDPFPNSVKNFFRLLPKPSGTQTASEQENGRLTGYGKSDANGFTGIIHQSDAEADIANSYYQSGGDVTNLPRGRRLSLRAKLDAVELPKNHFILKDGETPLVSQFFDFFRRRVKLSPNKEIRDQRDAKERIGSMKSAKGALPIKEIIGLVPGLREYLREKYGLDESKFLAHPSKPGYVWASFGHYSRGVEQEHQNKNALRHRGHGQRDAVNAMSNRQNGAVHEVWVGVTRWNNGKTLQGGLKETAGALWWIDELSLPCVATQEVKPGIVTDKPSVAHELRVAHELWEGASV